MVIDYLLLAFSLLFLVIVALIQYFNYRHYKASIEVIQRLRELDMEDFFGVDESQEDRILRRHDD